MRIVLTNKSGRNCGPAKADEHRQGPAPRPSQVSRAARMALRQQRRHAGPPHSRKGRIDAVDFKDGAWTHAALSEHGICDATHVETVRQQRQPLRIDVRTRLSFGRQELADWLAR